jgi:peroxiredoxin
MLALGTKMPSFALLDPSTQQMVSWADFKDAKGYMVAFICNHCPFVQVIRHELARYGREYTAKGVAVMLINSNDVDAYPEDSPENMVKEAQRFGYRFPYLFDADQSVAKAFDAACTPDFFLFDAAGVLVYRGQFDGARPGNDVPVTGQDLRAATEAMLAGEPVSSDQIPSLGCNIKWKA